MARMTYKALCTIGSALVLTSTSFLIGVIFSNQVYDFHILFNPEVTQQNYENSLKHYQAMFYTPPKVLYGFSGIVLVGLIGSLIRIYKPNPELQIFEYGSLGMFVLGICVFLTNIKTGVESSVHGTWGEVTQNQGLAVIASSNIILLLVFSGVIALQAGLWYTEWEYESRLEKYNKEHAEEVASASEPASAPKPASTPKNKPTKGKIH